MGGRAAPPRQKKYVDSVHLRPRPTTPLPRPLYAGADMLTRSSCILNFPNLCDYFLKEISLWNKKNL